MKTIGIQIKSYEAILVVLEQNEAGIIVQTNESSKFGIDDPSKPVQVRQFREQINSAFDSIDPRRIGIMARNAKATGLRAPSAMSFKLEGIIQLYEKNDIELVWPQSIAAFYKRNPRLLSPKHKYQQDAFDVAYYLLQDKR
jgi:hypothetical protein